MDGNEVKDWLDSAAARVIEGAIIEAARNGSVWPGAKAAVMDKARRQWRAQVRQALEDAAGRVLRDILTHSSGRISCSSSDPKFSIEIAQSMKLELPPIDMDQ